jgi:hypothetical protein
MQQTFRNQTASIILIDVQRFGRYEFSKGLLQFEILLKKAPLIKNDLFSGQYGQYIYRNIFRIDETTDITGRYMSNIVVSTRTLPSRTPGLKPDSV